jgi:hypothetical protein
MGGHLGRGHGMDLNKAFQFSVVLAWGDLLKVTSPCLVRVEYQRQPGVVLDHVTIWADKGRGYRDLVCHYWTSDSSMHPRGISFSNKYASDSLAKTLPFIMTNQDRFTQGSEIFGHGQIFIYQPDQKDRTEAEAWMATISGIGAISAEASSQMNEEGCPNVAPELLANVARA